VRAKHLPGHPPGDADEPTSHGGGLPHRLGPACEDQERGLERVVGRRWTDESPADAPDERSVPANQLGEGRFIAMGKEPAEQIGIRAFGLGVRKKAKNRCGHP